MVVQADSSQGGITISNNNRPYQLEVNQILKELDADVELNLECELSDESSFDSELDESRERRGQVHLPKKGLKIRLQESEEEEETQREIARAQKLEEAKMHLVGAENPVNRLSVEESDIPLDAIYNNHVNTQKHIEKSFHLKCKPLVFNIQKDYKGIEGINLARIIKQEEKESIVEHQFYEVAD